MKRTTCTAVLVSVLLAVLFGSACTARTTDVLTAARAHIDLMGEQLDLADAAFDGLADLDMAKSEASETVRLAIDTQASHTRAARRELALGAADVALAPDTVSKSQWREILGELDEAMGAHEALARAQEVYMRQMLVCGKCTVEIPASDNDLAQAWGWAAASQPDAMRLSADYALKNFSALATELASAHKLEPAAGLDGLAGYCRGRARISQLMLEAAKAMQAGQARKGNTILARASRLDQAMDKRGISEPAIMSAGYPDRVEPMRQHEDAHFAAAAKMLEALP